MSKRALPNPLWKDYYTVAEAAKLLGLTRAGIYWLIHHNGIAYEQLVGTRGRVIEDGQYYIPKYVIGSDALLRKALKAQRSGQRRLEAFLLSMTEKGGSAGGS